MKPIVSNWYYLPLDNLSEQSLRGIRKQLTVMPFVMQVGNIKKEAEPVEMFSFEKKGYIGVPIAWGFHNFGDDVVDLRSLGYDITVPKLPDPNHPKVLNPAAQRQFMEDMHTGALNHKNFIACSSTGCHAKGTKILMYSGEWKNVEDVKVGDQLMGDDSTPRNVLSLCRGRDTMYKVIPIKGKSFVVNSEHVLSLKRTNTGGSKSRGDGKLIEDKKNGMLVDISISDYLKTNKTFKHTHKLYRPESIKFNIDYIQEYGLELDPYLLGLFLGDGCITHGAKIANSDEEIHDYLSSVVSKYDCRIRKDYKKDSNSVTINFSRLGDRNTIIRLLIDLGLFGLKSGNKFIPKWYLLASYEDRMQLLAGLIDTDGYLQDNTIEYSSKSRQLTKDIKFLAQSLGFRCTVSIKNIKNYGKYYRVSISGYVENIPCKVKRRQATERRQKKSPLVTGFTIEELTEDNYYGFCLGGNHRYIMEDFFVTHNSGKTITALHTASKLGKSTLVLVHLERLMLQWIEEIKDKLGVEEKDIGIAQQNTCDFENKKFVVAMMHSIGLRKYPKEFYSNFGTIIIDEVHRVGAPLFSKSLSSFDAMYKIGLSATPDRKDGLAKVFYNHLGGVKVTSSSEALRCTVYPIKYKPLGIRTDNHAWILNLLSTDRRRNVLLSNIIKLLHEKDRQILVVSDRIDQLYEIKNFCIDKGIPEEDMGYFCRQKVTGDKVRKKQKNGKFGWVYPRVTVPNEELEDSKNNKRIILSTYSMIKEGIDIPRLDAGVEATPRSEAIQVIGRIRRPLPNKPHPVWYTIRDINVPKLERMYDKRLKDYRKSNVEVRE